MSMKPETLAHVRKLSLDHWDYVGLVLDAHGISPDVIAACGFHYRSAFEHGYKHALEDIAAEQPQQPQFGLGDK